MSRLRFRLLWLWPVVVALAGCGEVLGLAHDDDDAGTGSPVDGGGAQPDGATSHPDGGVIVIEQDAAACNGACGTGSKCTASGCQVTSGAGCATPVDVTPAGGRFRGTICADASPVGVCDQLSEPAHVFAMGSSAKGGFDLKFDSTTGPLYTNVVSSQCDYIMGKGCDNYGSNSHGTGSVPGGTRFAVGIGDAGCVDYDLTFTPK